MYEELGWKEAGLIDLDLLMTQCGRAVEAERLRAADWSANDIEQWLRAWDVRNLIEQSRPARGETFDHSHWAGPLADVITDYIGCDIGSHPYLRLVQAKAGRKRIEAMLIELGAPATCTVGHLECPWFHLAGKRPLPDGLSLQEGFDKGSKLQLKEALEITEESESEAVLFCLPGRLAYLQHHEIGSHPADGRAIAYRSP